MDDNKIQEATVRVKMLFNYLADGITLLRKDMNLGPDEVMVVCAQMGAYAAACTTKKEDTRLSPHDFFVTAFKLALANYAEQVTAIMLSPSPLDQKEKEIDALMKIVMPAPPKD